MTDKEKLYYLINEFIKGNYTPSVFCDEFTVQYDIETDYSILNDEENKCFGELSDMTARFSDDKEDLKIPNLYYSEQQVRTKVHEVAEKLNIMIK